jgi:hypothetical protein
MLLGASIDQPVRGLWPILKTFIAPIPRFLFIVYVPGHRWIFSN